MVALIRDSSNSGAMVPTWDNVCQFHEGSRPCGAGCCMSASICETEIAGHWIRNNSDHGALAPSQSYKRKLGEYGSDLQFPRARAPEYSAERGQAYLLSSEWVQESPCRSGRHARIQSPDSDRLSPPPFNWRLLWL